MAGLTKDSPLPTDIKVHQMSRRLEVAFSDGAHFEYPFEFLRVMSPSAEVRGHGPGQETLQTGKRDIDLSSVEPVGNYALQPTFSDGHATGIYSWDYLYDIGVNQKKLWADYLQRLADAGATREPGSSTTPAPAPRIHHHAPLQAVAAPGAAPLGTKHKL
jgi:DUF971 family protein